MTTVRRGLGAAIAIVLMSGIAAYAGVIESGQGPRAIGMGQAQVGAANDHSAAVYNPAALVQARDYWNLNGRTFWLQYGKSGYASYLKLDDVDQEYPFTSATTIGVLIPVGKRITAGITAYYPDDWTLVVLLASGPRFVRFVQTQQPVVNVGFGVKLTKWFSVGYTQEMHPNWNFSPITLDLAALLSGLGLSLGEPAVNVNPFMELDTILGYSYGFGGLLRPTKWLSIGASYMYKSGTDIFVPIVLPASILPETIITAKIRSNYRPTRLAFGVGVMPTEHMTFAFDLSYDMWSKVGFPWFNFQSNQNNIIPTTTTVVDLDDVWVPRVGFEYKNQLKGRLARANYALRAGYSFYPSPYPPLQETTVNIDSDANFYSAGLSLGYHPKKKLRYVAVDYYWEYIDLDKRTHTDITRNPAVIVSDGYVIYSGLALTIQI